MKTVVAAFNQEKALVGAFSVITTLRMQFGWNFLKHSDHGMLLLALAAIIISFSAAAVILNIVSAAAAGHGGCQPLLGDKHEIFYCAFNPQKIHNHRNIQHI